jgi:replicative DNA helicase
MIMTNRMNRNGQHEPGENGEDFGPTNYIHRPSQLVRLDQFLSKLVEDVSVGEPPPEYRIGDGSWGSLAFRPKEVTCIGGAPNTGKTALMLQAVIDTLIQFPRLRAVVANVEMGEEMLMERQFARLGRVFFGKIRRRERDGFFAEGIARAAEKLHAIADRLTFVRRPFTIEQIREVCHEHAPDLVCLDYLQRFRLETFQGDTKQQIGVIMDHVRAIADGGAAVLLAAALNRQASSRNQSRASATDDNVSDMAGFRDGSDIEYSIEDGYVLTKTAGNHVAVAGKSEYTPTKLVLRHVKARNDQTMHIPLLFDGRIQEFTRRPWDESEDDQGPRVATPPRRNPLRSSLNDTFMEDDNGTVWLS